MVAFKAYVGSNNGKKKPKQFQVTQIEKMMGLKLTITSQE